MKSAVMVKEFNVKILTEDGERVKLHRFDTLRKTPMFGSLTRMCPIEALFLDRELENRTLQPGEMVRGWVLLEIPDSVPKLQFQNNPDRMPEFYAEVIPMEGEPYETKIDSVQNYGWGGIQRISYTFGTCGDYSDRTIQNSSNDSD